MAQGKKPLLDLEWFTISYRSIALVSIIVVVVVGAAGYKHFLSDPSDVILRDIKKTEFDLEEMKSQVLVNPVLRSAHEDARGLIVQARIAYDEKNFAQAKQFVEQCLKNIDVLREELEKVQSGGTARFVNIDGDVKVKEAGDFRWIDARPDMTLREGYKIRAGSRGSAEIMFFNGDKQVLSPGSMMEINVSRVDPVTSAEQVSLHLSGASMRLTTPQKSKAGSYTRITTNTATVEVGAKRTALSVNPKKDRTEIRTEMGSALVRNISGKEVELHGDEAAVVYKKGPIEKRDIPAAPLLISPSPGQPFSFPRPEDNKVLFRWQPLPNIRTYQMMLSMSNLFVSPILDNKKIRPDPRGILIPRLPQGTYYWRIRAIDVRGFEGHWSVVRSFRISGTSSDTGEKPDLSITEAVPIGPFILLRGKTSPGAYLTIEDERYHVKEDGSFEATIRLKKLGKNEITVIVQMPGGGRVEQVYTAYYE